jgi:hypothetical protein
MRRSVLATSAAAAAAIWAAAEFARSRPLRMGATREEGGEPLPADELVPEPNYIRTAATTIHARPEDIFPWLLQIGQHRGGLYSYDFLDRMFGILDAPSAKTIIPEFQHLEPGDLIPVGRGGAFEVKAVEQDRCLVLGPEDAWITWQLALEPIDAEHTRLISRIRAKLPVAPLRRLKMISFDVATFIMIRRFLVVVRERAEGLAAERMYDRVGEETPLYPSASPEAMAEASMAPA